MVRKDSPDGASTNNPLLVNEPPSENDLLCDGDLLVLWRDQHSNVYHLLRSVGEVAHEATSSLGPVYIAVSACFRFWN